MGQEKNYSGGISEFVIAPKREDVFLDRDTFMDLSTRKRPAKRKTMKMRDVKKEERTRSRAQRIPCPFYGVLPVVSNFPLARCPRYHYFRLLGDESPSAAIIAGLVMDDAI